MLILGRRSFQNRFFQKNWHFENSTLKPYFKVRKSKKWPNSVQFLNKITPRTLTKVELFFWKIEISNFRTFPILHTLHRRLKEGYIERFIKSHSMLAGRYKDIKKYLASGKMPSNLPSTTSNFQREANRYTLEANGELSRQGKRVALYAVRMKIFNAFHKGSHQGRDGTWKKIKARYYWRGGQAFVAKKPRKILPYFTCIFNFFMWISCCFDFSSNIKSIVK